MEKENRELDDFVHYRHVAKSGESYFLTIVDDNGLRSINLSTFGKTQMTFGSANSNDIVLASNAVDDNQGVIEINEYGVLVTNDSLQVPMLGNGNKAFTSLYLSEGSFIKILDSDSNIGIVMIIIEQAKYPVSIKLRSYGSVCSIRNSTPSQQS